MKIFLIFISSVFSVFSGISSTNKSDSNFVNLDRKLLLKLVNDKRASGCNCGNKYMAAVPALAWSDILAKASSAHSKDMSKRKFFSHISYDGRTLKDRINTVGYKWSAIGENIAMGQRDEYEVFNSWLTSPEHCENMMSSNYLEMGAAREGEYWTQDFGRKRFWK